MTSKLPRSVASHIPASKSRREFLQYSGALVGASILVSSLPRRAQAQSAAFDYYISPTGSDSNPGTLASPWALTAINSKRSVYAGKRIGLLPGTYSCLTILGQSTYPGDFSTPAYTIQGGSAGSPTYIASCNASGTYTQLAAVLDGQGTSSTNPNSTPLLGSINGSSSSYITIDGLEIKNAYYHPIALGYATGGFFTLSTRCPGIVVQNNYIHTFTNVPAGQNAAAITVYAVTGAVIQNNYITGITDSSDRATGMEIWNSDTCIVQYNTIISTSSQQVGGIFIKNQGNWNNTIRYNLVDLSASGAVGGSNAGACVNDDDDGGSNSAGPSSSTDYFYNNIFIGDGIAFWADINVGAYPNYLCKQVWYNNTFLGIPGSSSIFWVRFGAPGTITYYNNLIKCTSGGFRGIMSSNEGPGAGTGSFALCDYNCYSNVNHGMSGYASGAAPPPPSLATTLPGWISQLPKACIGKEAHTLVATPAFVGGTPTLLGQAYKLASGSAGVRAGSTNGQTSGGAVDMGAWGGTDVNTGQPIAQVGVNFAPGSTTVAPAVPKAPVLSVT
jgi:hypothetical protein